MFSISHFNIFLNIYCYKCTAFSEVRNAWGEAYQHGCKKELNLRCINFDHPGELSKMIGAYKPIAGRGIRVRATYHYVFGNQIFIKMDFKEDIQGLRELARGQGKQCQG